MSWHQGRLAAFDIETTGIDCERDRIVTAAVSIVGAGQASEHYAWLVDPGIAIPVEATAVHGITTEQARAEGRPAGEAVAEIVDLLEARLREGIPVIAFNARFDLTFLDREARRYGVVPLVERLDGPAGLLVIDPFVLDKQFDRYRPGKRTLGAVCGHYRVALEDAHAASADALAAARVAWRLATHIEELGALDLPTLHERQVAWHDEQAISLQAYFAEQGRDERVERVWPIGPVPVPVTESVPAAIEPLPIAEAA